jgi:hypothetical protein
MELEIIRDPLEPIFITTHFVRELFLSNSWPAFTGFFIPVSDSAYHTIKFLKINITYAYHPPLMMPFKYIIDKIGPRLWEPRKAQCKQNPQKVDKNNAHMLIFKSNNWSNMANSDSLKLEGYRTKMKLGRITSSEVKSRTSLSLSERSSALFSSGVP